MNLKVCYVCVAERRNTIRLRLWSVLKWDTNFIYDTSFETAKVNPFYSTLSQLLYQMIAFCVGIKAWGSIPHK